MTSPPSSPNSGLGTQDNMDLTANVKKKIFLKSFCIEEFSRYDHVAFEHNVEDKRGTLLI